MRKYFVTGFYLLVIGGILLLGGILMGANRSVIWDHGFKVAQVKNETYPLDDFKNIYVEGRDANVSIKFGDRYKIHIDGDRSQAPTYKVKDGTLTVLGSTRKGRVGVDVLGREKITITIPMNKTLDNVNLKTANSKISISDVTINNLIKTAKDMDYDADLELNDVTIHNVDKLSLYNAELEMKNSNITNLSLTGSAYSEVESENTTLKNANINLDQSNMDIESSNIDSLKAFVNHGKVEISKTTLMNKNKVRILNKGRFTGEKLTVDGLKLNTDKGIVRYFDKSYGTSFENKTDETNLLDVKATKGTITIK
ncbi:DUF4097 family beta strand repeat protein [Companilactobacillus zhachilii]|jgi:hypothetical protein|uniref:DUF4097 domain-containing protein n=1 Tax=Companilactobacillus zhachilii TaxID=2304606 RepID=A0A386PRE0_9LACO|nr:DUF4097 family beta strand repeat-containing protein [Companilactobacillus zhachilii]AYE37485.1 hypothetical protein D1B17_01930 [Companilactobacillus zhachilii]MBL3531008.1 DUF4097 family beta strand repeat protein [Companilactobacillus zhachilii]